jgi:protein-S-isoprenylcysteine O-methyltransferase Ste14
MNFPGLPELSAHFPDLGSVPGRLKLGLRALAVFALATLFFLWTDRLIPDWQPDGQILALALGFAITGQFFWRRRAYQAEYAELAYRNAFVRFVLPGLAVIFATVAHCAYMPGIEIPNVWWKVYLSALGWVFLAVGTLLWARGLWTFGADNLALLYVYYPAESRLVDTQMYSILRHPVYAGVLRVTIGLCLLNGTWPALIFALLAPLGMTGWTRLVEERELLERFPGYAEYRQRVPAFWTWQAGKFWRFLLRGE